MNDHKKYTTYLIAPFAPSTSVIRLYNAYYIKFGSKSIIVLWARAFFVFPWYGSIPDHINLIMIQYAL